MSTKRQRRLRSKRLYGKRLYGKCCSPGCPFCAAARQHKHRKRLAAARDQLESIYKTEITLTDEDETEKTVTLDDLIHCGDSLQEPSRNDSKRE